MPDDLRTRIAAVHQQHRLFSRMVGRKIDKQCLCGWRSPERDCTWTDHPDHLADVLIRELNRQNLLDNPVWKWLVLNEPVIAHRYMSSLS